MHDSPFAVFLIFLRLGLTSFGGPIAHLGYFRTEFVERRKPPELGFVILTGAARGGMTDTQTQAGRIVT